MCISSPVLDIGWVSPQKTVIRNTSNKYDITDFGRVLTIMKAEQKDEGVYYCKGKGKTGFSEQRVNFNVTCRIFLPFLKKKVLQSFGKLFLIKDYHILKNISFSISTRCLRMLQIHLSLFGYYSGSFSDWK